MKKLERFTPILVVAMLFAASTATTIAQAQRGDAIEVKNPVAQLILQKFNPEPGLYVENNIVVSCEPAVSVDVFTATELQDAVFTATNEDGEVLGAVNYDVIYPLWHTVEFEDLSHFPFSGKISVSMKAETENGENVSKTLTIDPDCQEEQGRKGITNEVVVLQPSAHELSSPLPKNTETLTNKFFIPDLILAIPRETKGSATITVNAHLGTNESGYLLGSVQKVTETEITTLSMKDVSPVEIPVCASSFDVFYQIEVKNHDSGDVFSTNTRVKVIDSSILGESPQSTADKDGCMVEIEPGLWAEELKVGTGAEAEPGDSITVHYILKSEDGSVVDSSYARNRPLEFELGAGRVIDGWELGVPGIKEAGERKLKISSELGYGDEQIRNLPPNSTLISEIKLLDVKK